MPEKRVRKPSGIIPEPPARANAPGLSPTAASNRQQARLRAAAYPKTWVMACVALELLGALPKRRDGVEWAVIRRMNCLPYHGLRKPMEAAGLIECRRQRGDDCRLRNRYEVRLTAKGLEVARSAGDGPRAEAKAAVSAHWRARQERVQAWAARCVELERRRAAGLAREDLDSLAHRIDAAHEGGGDPEWVGLLLRRALRAVRRRRLRWSVWRSEYIRIPPAQVVAYLNAATARWLAQGGDQS